MIYATDSAEDVLFFVSFAHVYVIAQIVALLEGSIIERDRCCHIDRLPMQRWLIRPFGTWKGRPFAFTRR